MDIKITYMDINNFDENGKRHGYWIEEEEWGIFLSKGNYIHGLKNGTWKRQYKRSKKIREVLGINMGFLINRLNHWTDTNNDTYEVDYESQSHEFRAIHSEEYYD